jgi:mRNA interferase RelE/StbE
VSWRLQIAKRALKGLARIPAKDRQRIMTALAEMRENPFSGDIVRLKCQGTGWRRRVGNYRILFDVYLEAFVVDVVDITRRTSTTY